MKSPAKRSAPKPRILCVEDDVNLQKSLSFILWREGYEVLCAQTGEEALELARREKPDLILLDLVLPGNRRPQSLQHPEKGPRHVRDPDHHGDGQKTDRRYRRRLERTTADDYVTKPFEPQILLARIQALLRRKVQSAEDQKTTLEIDGLVINRGAYEVLAGGRKIALTKTEFEILALLAGKPNQVFTRSRILDNVREDGYPITERVVDYHLTGLRKKLGEAKKYIQTVRGVGYKFNVGEGS